MRLAPRNTQAAYEAALVYAVLGDQERAVEQATRAREDFEPRWLTLPWFDEMRQDPRFQALLEP